MSIMKILNIYGILLKINIELNVIVYIYSQKKEQKAYKLSALNLR